MNLEPLKNEPIPIMNDYEVQGNVSEINSYNI